MTTPYIVPVLLVVLGIAVASVAAWLWWRRRPVCKLTLREKGAVGLEFHLTRRGATIGSEEGRTIVISDPRVSALHAILSWEEGKFILRDRSRHGLTVNGEPIEETVLKSGDLISLADSVDLIFTRLA